MGKNRSSSRQKTFLSVTGLVILLIILILVNILVSYANIRWDVTEDRVYSLSQGTKNILASLKNPVVIKFFFSRSNPNIPAGIELYAKRIRDFLSEYEHAGKNKVQVEFYDPRPDSDEEEWAERYGIEPIQPPGGEKIYCGLVLVSADHEEVIEWLDPSQEKSLEYNVTRIIQDLQSVRRKVVGVISDLPVFGAAERQSLPGQKPEGPWFFIEELKKAYDVRNIEASATEIDPDVDVLMIIYPKTVSEGLRYAVDQHVLSGGNVLVFADPLCVSDRSQGPQQYMGSAGASLPLLFASWGVSMDPKMAIADFDQPTRVMTRSNTPEENPLMISARGFSFNQEDIVTSGLESMLFPIAGAISQVEGAGFQFEPLVVSSENAAVIQAFKAYMGVEAIKKDFVPAGKRFNIAVRIRGKFKTAFPGGFKGENSPVSDGKSKTKRPHAEEGAKEATIIIVSDADMLANHFYMQQRNLLGFAISEMFNDNLNFVANVSEILTGSDDLIQLRSRGKFERPFTAVLKLRKKAQEKWLSKENELVARIEETNQKLRELDKEKSASQKLVVSPEQEAEITRFRDEKQKINRELKEVRKNLRSEIEDLGARIKWVNILLMPFLVSLIGIGFAMYKHRKLKKR